MTEVLSDTMFGVVCTKGERAPRKGKKNCPLKLPFILSDKKGDLIFEHYSVTWCT